MEDVKIHNVQPVAEPRATEKRSQKPVGDGGAFGDTLAGAVDRMNTLKHQADAAAPAQRGPDSIQEEITTARELYERIMLEKQNLARLYHRIRTNPTDKA